MSFIKKIIYSFLFLLSVHYTYAQEKPAETFSVKENYSKKEVYITMRDGVRLFTAIYTPKDGGTYPVLMQRTPYSCFPYGEDKFPGRLGPNADLMKGKYIFVYQDVRGRYKSEGSFEEMTPAIPGKKTSKQTDESSDTYDTIDWLLKNTVNNGKVGIYGISYPGFYASASLPDAHPALKAVSPQAPVSDEFIGDDCYHNGAFFLLDNFGFYNYFDGKRDANGEGYGQVFSVNYRDAYRFFLRTGSLKNILVKYFADKKSIFNQAAVNDTYNSFWKTRNIRQHLQNIKPAVLVVGGWFDAEDLFGALKTYEAIEKQTPGNKNWLVMAPWTHGAWAAANWTKYASYDFGQNLNEYYHNEIETKFFNYYLKETGEFNPAEITVFETGSNQWKKYDTWPPANSTPVNYYLHANGTISTSSPNDKTAASEYTSDPAKPVPYTSAVSPGRNNEYMGEDQRFASQRPDVLSFETDTLTEDITITGKVVANLFVSISSTDADFVVKLIDVLPEYERNPDPNPKNYQMGGMQRLVRAEVFRGKFRNSYEKPQPFTPNKTEKIRFELNETAHTFKKGHRIMVQIQSSWFPLVDRNPQKFIRIPDANEKDYQKATIRILHDAVNNSHITLPVLR